MKSKEEIEKSANEFSKDYIKTTSNSILQSTFKLEVGYIKGYTQCQEDNKPFFTEETWNTMCSRISELQSELKNKKYTEEDLMSAFNAGINNDYGNGLSFDQWLNSLNKQD
jgi:hypothetical protein